MTSVRVFLTGLAVACSLASAASAAPLEAYAELPLIEDIALSKDGTMIAMVVTDVDKRKLLVRPVASQEGARLVNLTGGIVRDIAWLDSTHLSILSNFSDGRQPYAGPAYSQVNVDIFNTETNRMENWRDRSKASPGKRAKLPYQRWPVDDEGRLSIGVRYFEPTGEWTIRVLDSNRIYRDLVKGRDALAPPRILARGKSPDSVLVAMNTPNGATVRELNTKDGTWGADLPYSPDAKVFIDDDGNLYGVETIVGDERRIEFYAKADQQIWESLKKSFPKDDVRIVSWSKDHKIIVVELISTTTPPGYVLVDMNTKKASFIANRYGVIAAKDVSPVSAINYRAADGLEINGYLTLPAGRQAKGLPLIVMPHGGPALRDYLGYDWLAQALASRGYAVLQPNFRGSGGYGYAFEKAGFGEWGRKMQTDLSDGVRQLAAQGVIDPKRVCIFGASYGGYAALAGATFDRGVYRCAASYAGPSQLQEMLAPDKSKASGSGVRYWATMIGVKDAKDKALLDLSPALHADQVDIPILLIHGKNDQVVADEQSRFMYEALKKAAKPVELVWLDGEDHQLSLAATRKAMVSALVAFLEKNNPPN